MAGWAIERSVLPPATLSADELRELANRLYEVDLGPVRELYTEVIHKIRDLGIAFSDRRAVKAQKLLAASALLCTRLVARPSDLWVLRYVWDRAEQIGPLRGLLQGVLQQHPPTDDAHPLAILPEKADGEEIARQLDAIAAELPDLGGKGRPPSLSLLALARLRERLAELADRAAWVVDEKARRHLLERSGKLLEQVGVAMSNLLADVSCARVPAGALAHLGALRAYEALRGLPDGDSLWLFWPAGDSELARAVLAVAGAELFLRAEGAWRRPGEHLPVFHVPDPHMAKPLSALLFPAPTTAVPPGAPAWRPAPLALVRDATPRAASALLVSAEELAALGGCGDKPAVPGIAGGALRR